MLDPGDTWSGYLRQVLKYEFNEDDSMARYKALLVTQGHLTGGR